MINKQKKFLISGLTLMLLIFFLDTLIPLGVAGGVPYILVILVSLWCENNYITLITAVVCSALTILGFYSSPEGGQFWQILINRFLALFAIWTVTVLSLQRSKTLEEKAEAVKLHEKALSELKILQGFIPICASCKKIRNEEGNWDQMEVYITEHSEADFTHSVCPDCAKKLYPGLTKK